MKNRSQDDAPNSPNEIYVPPSGPPQGGGPSREIYALMGEANIFRMCEDFYLELEKTDIRPMFPEDMLHASRKLASFLVQICGGPPLFNQFFGQPMMRARHIKFPIGEHERQAWLGAFKKNFEGADRKYNFPAQHMPDFIRFLEEFSAWMVNRAPCGGGDPKPE